MDRCTDRAGRDYVNLAAAILDVQEAAGTCPAPKQPLNLPKQPCLPPAQLCTAPRPAPCTLNPT